MRGYVFLAAGLFATNLVIVHETGPAKPQPAAEPILVESQPRVITGESTEGQRLRWFWQAKHNALRIPRCDQFDPLAVLDIDADPAPGIEHLVGNRQFGVMMFDAEGTLLAHMDPVGCAEPSVQDQSLSISFDDRLIIRTRNMFEDGEHLFATVAERRGDEIVKLVEFDTGGNRTDWQVDGRIVMLPHEVEVIYHGRLRTSRDGEWEGVDEHCLWQLATQTSSCRTRAGGRTRGSE